MQAFKDWLFQAEQRVNALPDNDKRALLIMIVVVALGAAYWTLTSSYKSQQQAKQFYEKSVMDFKWLQANEAHVRARQAQPVQPAADSGDGSSIINRITTSAKPFGMDIKRFQPEGETGLRLWLEQAEFDQLLRWLAALEKQQLSIEQLDIDRVKDRPGLVDVRILLSQPAP